ncbi:MAG: STAS domain-containing protein [Planctomycetes bacterium]|nr:STAS domain-containing protein [Planctomycetota bacterium]
MSTDQPTITCDTRLHDDVHEVCLSGSLCDDGIDVARQALADLIDQDAPKIAINMGGVDYVSSSGIGMLVSVLKRCHQSNVAFALCNLTEDIHELFSLTRLDQVFTMAPDVQSWRRSL